ncbi:MAG: hypothetical protein HQL30_01930 [Candidatus Omnitrophica bacterium]|nr:hypothetical protein [Candidatus Omnitrophota bacterium]
MKRIGQNSGEAILNRNASEKANLAEKFAREYWARKKKKDENVPDGSGNEFPSSQVLDNGEKINFEYTRNDAGNIVSVKAKIDDNTEMQLNADGSVTISSSSSVIPDMIDTVNALTPDRTSYDIKHDGVIDSQEDLNGDGIYDAKDRNMTSDAIPADILNDLPPSTRNKYTFDNMTPNLVVTEDAKELNGKEPIIVTYSKDKSDTDARKEEPAASKPTYLDPERVREFISGFKDKRNTRNIEKISGLLDELEAGKDLVSGIKLDYEKLLYKMKSSLKASVVLPNISNDISLVENIMDAVKNNGENPFNDDEQKNEIIKAYDQVRKNTDPKLVKIEAQLRSFYGNLSVLCKKFSTESSVIYLRYTSDNSFKVIINLQKAKQIAVSNDSFKDDKIPAAYAESTGK